MNSASQAQVLCHFKCDDHLKNISNLFNSLHSTDSLVDLTISCQGGSFRAHKFVLSACSPYFKRILNENPCKHPTFIMHGILFEDMKLLLEFMYKGAVSVPEDSINSLVEIATNLEIKGFRFDRDLTSKPADGFVLKCKPDGPAAIASSAADSIDDRPKSKKKCTYGIRADVKAKQNDQDEYVEIEEVDSGIDTEKNKLPLGSNGTNSGRQTRFRGLKRVPVGEVVYSDDYYPDSGRNSVQKRQLATNTTVSSKVADDCFSNIVIKDIRGANGSLCLSVASKTNEPLQTENALDPDVMSLIPDITISEQVHKSDEIDDLKKDEHLIKNEYITNDKIKEENNTEQKDNFTFPQKSVNPKPFRCEFCKLGFTRSSHLLRHRRTHTGERPFACKNCDKAFSRQDKLRIHMMRTHEDVFKPKFVCEYCEKVFERQESLKAHMTKHDYEYVPNKYKVPVNLHSSIGIDEQSNVQSGSQSITQSIIQTVKEFTNTSSNSTAVVATEIPTSPSNSASKLLKRKRGRPRTREIPINKEKRRRGRPRKLSVEGEYSNQDNYDLMSLPFGDFSYLTSELPIQLPNSSVGVPEVIETTPTLPVLSPTPESVVVPVDVPEQQQQQEEQVHQQQQQPIEDNDPQTPLPPQSESANELINSIRVIGECTISPLN